MPTRDREEIIESVVDRANGIFLWVKWALQDLWTALDQKQDNVYLLQRLRVLPEEMDVFFRQIIDSIPKQDRREAWAIFAMLTATSGSTTFDQRPALDSYNLRPELIEYSYLKDLDRTTDLWTDTNEFAAQIRESDLNQRENSFRARIKGLCRGLVDVESAHPGTKKVFESLAFTHRSIYDMLEDNLLIDSEIRKFFESFDPQTRLIQFLIIMTELWPQTDRRRKWRVSARCYGLVALLKYSKLPHHLGNLGFLEDRLLEWQRELWDGEKADWQIFHSGRPLYCPSGLTEVISVLAMSSVVMDDVDFVESYLSKKSMWLADERARTKLLVYLSERVARWGHPKNTLRYLLENGSDPNSCQCNAGSNSSPWQFFLSKVLLSNHHPSDVVWEIMETFLEKSINTNLELEVRGAPETRSDDSTHLELIIIISRCLNDHPIRREVSSSRGSWLYELASQTLHLSLRNCVEYCKPPNIVKLLRLIEQDSERQARSAKTAGRLRDVGDTLGWKAISFLVIPGKVTQISSRDESFCHTYFCNSRHFIASISCSAKITNATNCGDMGSVLTAS